MAIYSIEWGWQAFQDLHPGLFFSRKTLVRSLGGRYGTNETPESVPDPNR
jgi:hypothetical protein